LLRYLTDSAATPFRGVRTRWLKKEAQVKYEAASQSLLTFISQMVSSLAWPTTILICVALLRRHLMAIVPLVRTVKYSDLEIRFGQEVAEMKKAADIAELPKEQVASQNDQWQTLIRLAEVRPRSAIRASWRQVEDTIDRLATEKGVQVADAAQSMPMVVGAILLNQGFVSTSQYELMQKLRLLFHQAERSEPDSLTPQNATEYVELALRLIASIQLKTKQL
jgi:hypothetical protein